jgi:hypothetical protein
LQISQGYIIRILQHFGTKLWNITNFVMLFHAMMEFCLDLLRSKFWLIGEWSIASKSLSKPDAYTNMLTHAGSREAINIGEVSSSFDKLFLGF